jgi:hypothetical protein
MTSYGDSRRAAAAQQDLSKLVGTATVVSLVLLDEDGREQRPIEGEVIRVSIDSVIFRHDGLDEELSLATISKRIHGDAVLAY